MGIARQVAGLSVVSAMAFATPACGTRFDASAGWVAPEDTVLCVDRTGRRIGDSNCDPRPGGPPAGRWYYVGPGARVPAYGAPATGGAFDEPAGRHFTRSEESAARLAHGR